MLAYKVINEENRQDDNQRYNVCVCTDNVCQLYLISVISGNTSSRAHTPAFPPDEESMTSSSLNEGMCTHALSPSPPPLSLISPSLPHLPLSPSSPPLSLISPSLPHLPLSPSSPPLSLISPSLPHLPLSLSPSPSPSSPPLSLTSPSLPHLPPLSLISPSLPCFLDVAKSELMKMFKEVTSSSEDEEEEEEISMSLYISLYIPSSSTFSPFFLSC